LFLQTTFPREPLTLVSFSAFQSPRSDFKPYISVNNFPGSGSVELNATEPPIDTSTTAGMSFFDMLSVFAEFLTNLRHERQAERIAQTKH